VVAFGLHCPARVAVGGVGWWWGTLFVNGIPLLEAMRARSWSIYSLYFFFRNYYQVLHISKFAAVAGKLLCDLALSLQYQRAIDPDRGSLFSRVRSSWVQYRSAASA